jgi:hypothetical protein
MAIKVKELKDDTLLDVKVNKSYYLMLKSTLFYIFQQEKEASKREESLKVIKEGNFEKMNEYERSFYTITLILAEIEKQATNNSLFEEKELLEPGDEGYVEPTQD